MAFDFAEVVVHHVCFARFDGDFGVERFEERGFATTYLSDEVDEFPFFDFKVDAFENDIFLLADVHVDELCQEFDDYL